jgi:F-type H+-transporting ATPase subunit b
VNGLHFDPGLTFWSLVTFACLLWLLARFAFKPLARVLHEREEQIRASLQEAAQARDEARELLTRNEAQLQSARDETRRIIDEGHRIVADMKREAREQARRDAEQIVGQARGEIDREVQRSLEDLKGTVANLSVRIARQVIRGELDEQRHTELADDFIDRLKKTHAVRRQS